MWSDGNEDKGKGRIEVKKGGEGKEISEGK